MFVTPPKFSVWALLLFGVAIRCVALTQPLVDAHLLRQCQTAAATRSLIELPGWSLASRIPWLGDLDARFILEAPVYNYLVIGIHIVVGDLDLSGKITTILLWAISFLLLQGIWRRLLKPEHVPWANVLFVVAPLEVFFGQAFMPEMLVQTLAFGFLLLALRYGEAPTLARWIACAVVGLVGLLVKFPEIIHLYAILGFVLVRRLGWKAVWWPRHVVAGVASVCVLKLWGGYVDSINVVHLPEWSAEASLRGFLGSWASRIQWKPWANVCGYLALFVVPGFAACGIAVGLWVALRQRFLSLLKVWLLTLIAYYLVWFGNAGTVQSYYNLPAVAPLCALFAIGITAGARLLPSGRCRWSATAGAVVLLAASVVPGAMYLFERDRPILAAARWAREHTRPGEVLILRPNHRWDMVEYPYNPVLAYYSDRPTFVWTRHTPEPLRQAALARARYAIITTPAPPSSGLAAAISGFRGAKMPALETNDWLESGKFTPLVSAEGFTVHRRQGDGFPVPAFPAPSAAPGTPRPSR
jgi:hypothetical protein